VAKPKAHGQAIIKTLTIVTVAKVKFPIARNQTTKVVTAIKIITGTNQPVILSVSFWMGALEF
jgi:hypothetical protein